MSVFSGLLIFIFGVCLGAMIVFVLWLMEMSRELNDYEMKIATLEADIECIEERINEIDEILEGEEKQ